MSFTFRSVRETDVEKLVVLYATNEEFTSFIANEAVDPFRTTSYMDKVLVLDDIFRIKLRRKTVSEIRLTDFQSEEMDSLLNQLPNLLKTYVIKTDYEFGNNKKVDENFCYIVYRIIQSERVFKSFKTFETAFLKASALRYDYKKYAKKFSAAEEEDEVKPEPEEEKPGREQDIVDEEFETESEFEDDE